MYITTTKFLESTAVVMYAVDPWFNIASHHPKFMSFKQADITNHKLLIGTWVMHHHKTFLDQIITLS